MSEYIRRLRAKIGSELLLLPSVTVLAFDANERVVLVRHSNQGLWVAPGGMIEPDETPEAAALREMREETGYEVELLRILGVYGGRPEFRIQYRNGDEAAYVMTVYEARLRAGSPRPDGEEVLEVGLFSADEASDLPMASWLPIVLDDAWARRGLS